MIVGATPTDDFPENLLEFEQRFSTEAACRDYLVQLRWPDGFRCRRCGHGKVWRTQRNVMVCTQCQAETSIIAGTVLEGTRKPLRVWFRAMWWVATQKTGLSAKAFVREMGLPSYETAWTWLHKLRRAMVRAGRQKLVGRIEVDETFIGGEEAGLSGRQSGDKALVVIAAEEDGKGIGRIRLRHVTDASAASLIPFVEASVEPGSVVHTDGWQGYTGLSAKGYKHKVTVLGSDPKRASKLLPRVHRVASLLKRWLLGTHQGAVSNKHLQRYLDEYTFRFNRRRSRHPGKIFFRLAQQVVVVKKTTYRALVDSSDGPGGLKPTTG